MLILAPQARVYQLGSYRVLCKPLDSNPAWSTHWIYRGDALIGKQLSVPTIDDCRWYHRRHGVYATQQESAVPFKGYQMQSIARRKRPTDLVRKSQAAEVT